MTRSHNAKIESPAQQRHMQCYCVVLLLASFFVCQALPDGDLCKWMNGRKYYVDVGETGIISVGNVTSQVEGNHSTHPRIPQRCSVELVTCASCHITVTMLSMDIPTCSSDSSCRCDYVWVKEPAYGKSGQEFCGTVNNNQTLPRYESKTKLLSIDFLYSYSYSEAFSLQFTAEKNVYILKGRHEYYLFNNTGHFQSPHFPLGYPTDYSAEYFIRNLDRNGFIQLVFTDFQLSPWSYIEVFDSNGTRISIYNGNTFRPPIMMSSGPTLTVKFRANNEYPNPGFKAKYTFVNYPEKYWLQRPSTGCGGYVEDHGGAITMMNMAAGSSIRSFDCIWLVRSRPSSYSYGTHLSIRVAQFEDMGPNSMLEIRQGLTSESYLLDSLSGYQHHKMPRGQEHVVPASSGFYVRLQGVFNNKSRLAIVYAAFRYEDCFSLGDFECDNGRCLKNTLHCDGFNHCGDGSDESNCYGSAAGVLSPEDANWWRTLTPNYYFPKQDGAATAGTNMLILITSLAGLGMFVLTTTMILVKLHKQRREESLNREMLRTISGEIDGGESRNRTPTDPPLYDPPPSYDDVIKSYLPPPAYTSVVNQQSRMQQQSDSNSYGIENIGFVSDCTAPVPASSRQPRLRATATQVAPGNENLSPIRIAMPSSSSAKHQQRVSKNNLADNCFAIPSSHASENSSQLPTAHETIIPIPLQPNRINISQATSPNLITQTTCTQDFVPVAGQGLESSRGYQNVSCSTASEEQHVPLNSNGCLNPSSLSYCNCNGACSCPAPPPPYSRRNAFLDPNCQHLHKAYSESDTEKIHETDTTQQDAPQVSAELGLAAPAGITVSSSTSDCHSANAADVVESCTRTLCTSSDAAPKLLPPPPPLSLNSESRHRFPKSQHHELQSETRGQKLNNPSLQSTENLLEPMREVCDATNDPQSLHDPDSLFFTWYGENVDYGFDALHCIPSETERLSADTNLQTVPHHSRSKSQGNIDFCEGFLPDVPTTHIQPRVKNEQNTSANSVAHLRRTKSQPKMEPSIEDDTFMCGRQSKFSDNISLVKLKHIADAVLSAKSPNKQYVLTNSSSDA